MPRTKRPTPPAPDFAAAKGRRVDLGEGIIHTVGESLVNVADTEEQFGLLSAKIRLANGMQCFGVVSLCIHDSCEHYGTVIFVPDGAAGVKVAIQGERDFLSVLGLKKEDVFPYRYNYRTLNPGAVYRDHHIDSCYWSR